MPEDKKVFNNQKELCDYLLLKYGKSDGVLNENKGIFSIWYTTTQLWYDSSVCTCRKKGMTEDKINKLYVMLGNLKYDEIEKQKAKKIVDGNIVLMYNGEVLVEIN